MFQTRAFFRIFVVTLCSLFATLAFTSAVSAQQFRWVWTTSLNLGGAGSQGPSVDPVALCQRIKAGTTSLYYQGIWYSHLEYVSPTLATCWDHHDEIIAGQPREDQQFDITRTCVRFDDNGSTSTVAAYNCEVPCPCEWTVGNPIIVQSLINIERSEDFVSALDARFAFLRNYRSDASFIGATAGFDPLTGNSGLGVFSFDGPWRLNFDEVIQQNSGTYRYRLWTGQTVRFTSLGSTTPPGTGWPYTISTSTSPFGTRWLVEDGTGVRRYFSGTSATRYLSEIVWPDGYTITITRNATHRGITVIGDNRGQRAQFTWSAVPTPHVDPGVVTRIDIDLAYGGGTFSPDVALTYDFTVGTSSWAASTISQVSILDLAATTSEVQAAYVYQPDTLAYPPALTIVYDGRRDGSGLLLASSFTTYIPGTSLAEETYRPGTMSRYALDPTWINYGATLDSVDVTNPLGLVTTYELGGRYGAIRVVDQSINPTANVAAATQSFDYTPNSGGATGFLYQRTEWNGSITEIERNGRGLVVRKTEDAAGSDPRVTTYTWHATLRLPLTRTTALLKETFGYDANGLLTSYSQEDVLTGSPDFGQVRSWSYGYTTLASGLKVLTSINGPGTSGVSDITTLTYTAAGRLTKITDPNGVATEILAYDGFGRPSQVKDEQGFTWALSYDVEGRMVQAVFSPGTAAQETLGFTYDAIGQMLTSTDAMGRVWTYTYDDAQRLTAIEAPGGESMAFTHDAMGNVTETTYADAALITRYMAESSFDELGRLLQSLGANGQVAGFDYDVESNLTGETDPLSFTTLYHYDPLNRMVGIVDRENYNTSYAYDDADNLTAFDDPRGLATGFAYNGFSEVVQEVSPDRGTWTYAHDSRGLVTSITDGRGVARNYTYDNGGRITAVAFPSQPSLDQTWEYYTNPAEAWHFGLLRRVIEGSGTTQFEYSSTTGDLIEEQRTLDSVTYDTGYEWQVRGELRIIDYPSRSRLVLTRDANGNSQSVLWDEYDPVTATYAPRQTVAGGITYAPFGPVTGMTYGDGGVHSADYDLSYRPTGLTDIRAATILRDTGYLWTLRDDLASVSDTLTPALDEAYEYDPRQHLAAADGPWGAFDWTYDGVGNRTSEALDTGLGPVTDIYAYPPGDNRLASITFGVGGAAALTHDAMGNVTRDNDGVSDWTYSYDAAGRMASVALNGVTRGQYRYNFMGQHVRRQLASGQVIHALHDTDGHRIAEFLYDPATETSTKIREYLWADDRIVGVSEGGVLYFVRTDHIGRPVFATDTSGTVIWTANYLPFGGIHVSSGLPIDLRFPGQWFQSESGLFQNWMRDYDPTTGRYLQADPLGLVDGASVYGYARQSPLRWTDPRGEFIPQIVWCLVNPICRTAAGAFAGFVYGYLVDDDNCYTWTEMAYYSGVGASSFWGMGRASRPLFSPSGPFRPGTWMNSGGNWRIGWGRAPGNRTVFRIAGGSPRVGNHWHIDLYFP